MFFKIMSAFTEVTEVDRSEDKKKKQKPRFIFNQMLSRCVINRRQNRELEKHQEKTSSVNEKEKAEVKLRAALVLNVTN